MSSPNDPSAPLAFTPASLAAIDGAPVFELRPCGWRERRRHAREQVIKRVRWHDTAAIRGEVLRGLEATWGAEDYAKHLPIMEGFWAAADRHAEELKTNPEATFDFDEELRQAVIDLGTKVAEEWEPLRRMAAENGEFADLSLQLMVAVVLRGWTGLSTPLAVEDGMRISIGILSLDCVAALVAELSEFEKRHGLEPGIAALELGTACADRLYPPSKAGEAVATIKRAAAAEIAGDPVVIRDQPVASAPAKPRRRTKGGRHAAR